MKLAESMERTNVQLSQTMSAWGQFVDRDPNDSQTGIYGTAAGVEILTLAGYRADHEVLIKAAAAISDWFPAEGRRYVKKKDFTVTYKLASYLNSIEPAAQTVATEPSQATVLIESRIPGQGWGNYVEPGGARDTQSRVVPTARALIALRRYRSFLGSTASAESLQWLLRRAAASDDLDPAARAVALYAVVRFPDAKNLVGADYDQLVSLTVAGLLSWIDHQKSLRSLSIFPDYYPVLQDGEPATRYMHTPREIMVALALMAAAEPRGSHYALSVARLVAKQIQKHGGIVVDGRIFCKQQLWAARLLRAVMDTSSDWFQPGPVAIVRGHRVAGRILAIVVLVLLSLPGLLWTIDSLPRHWGSRLARLPVVALSVVFLGLATMQVVGLVQDARRSKR